MNLDSMNRHWKQEYGTLLFSNVTNRTIKLLKKNIPGGLLKLEDEDSPAVIVLW